jgi:hypothetical protein
MWSHQNSAQHVMAPELALSLEAPVDQSIEDYFAQGFAVLDITATLPRSFVEASIASC